MLVTPPSSGASRTVPGNRHVPPHPGDATAATSSVTEIGARVRWFMCAFVPPLPTGRGGQGERYDKGHACCSPHSLFVPPLPTGRGGQGERYLEGERGETYCYPPANGGSNATSSPGRTGVSARACFRLTAASGRSGSCAPPGSAERASRTT